MTNEQTIQYGGGPAFPQSVATPIFSYDCVDGSGMTLRDYFAAKALIALPHIGCGADLGFTELAADAYRFADAMLEARKK